MRRIQILLHKALTHQLGTPHQQVFLSFNPRTLSGQRMCSAGQNTTGQWFSVQLFSFLIIHSQLDALSAACPSLPTALFLSPLLIPRLLSILHTDWAGNPLHSSYFHGEQPGTPATPSTLFL
ncbi:hypothetical protein DPMN_174318 [Dreissena polymorpha]|uniref:Uncharacterized protein n=1 Tax=Dreissena polymorpha TaxID=45954 RepID=A0A9D4IGA6_DREPO|nr:hypothetical protein DPMN_174318 [Dreissena polymorpha]